MPLPLPEGEWVNVTSNLSHEPSECGNLSLGAAKPDEDLLIVGVAQRGLWGSRDGGESWEQLGSSSDPEPIINRASSLLFDPDSPEIFWESGIYNGMGIFKTTDSGASFTPQNTTHNDFISVDFTDPDRNTVLASGHEQIHKLLLSKDGAATWTEIGDFIPDGPLVCGFPYVVDSETFLLGCGSYSGGTTGIFRSTDAGGSWEQVSEFGGGSAPLLTKDGTLYWASEGRLGATKSLDNGETWSEPFGVGIVSTPTPRTAPVELPDGRIAALSTESIIVSDDGGDTWQAASPALPYEPSSFFYSSHQRAFFITRSTCGIGTDAVPANGVMRFDFDYETD